MMFLFRRRVAALALALALAFRAVVGFQHHHQQTSVAFTSQRKKLSVLLLSVAATSPSAFLDYNDNNNSNDPVINVTTAYLAKSISDVADVLWNEDDEDTVQEQVDKKRRQVMNRIASGVAASAEDSKQAVDSNKYELTLTRPIGLVLQETSDGYVQVAGYSENAPTLVKYAVQVGDRVLAVDSSLGGNRLWPVSTVEGVISACTSRLPGSSIRMQFERTNTSNKANRDVAAKNAVTASLTKEMAAATTVDEVVDKKVAMPRGDNKALLSRCRKILRRYANDETFLSTQSQFSGKFALPAIVADKVLDALASASSSIDVVTLSMIMKAYLSCQQPNGALRAFEAATGFSADGSLNPPAEDLVTGSTNGNRIAPSESALNLFTGTSLLQAHAMRGDIHSVARVVAALEGCSGVEYGRSESAPWPWTGAYGSIQPDTRCYNIAIAAAERVGGSEALNFAMEIFGRMADPSDSFVASSKNNGSRRPVKDVVTYNTLISALTNAGESERAFELFDQMRRTLVRPDKYTYTSLIKACRNDGDVQELLYDMREYGIEADNVTYNAMIKALCESRKWTQATRLVTDMESRGVAPDSMTCGYLMNAMLKADKPNACLALFESACANARTSALTENIYLFTTAVTAASVLQDYERALELVARMKAKGISPNLKTLTAVIGACLSAGKPDLAAQLYRRIEKPDGYAAAQGIRALCADGDISSALDLLALQKRGKGSLMSGKDIMRSYAVVVRAALSQNKYSIARTTITDLFGKGYIPNRAIFSAIIDEMETPGDNAGSDAHQNFAFSLFVIDSLLKRNLPIDGRFYAATIFLGSSLGGLCRKVASALVQSKISAVNNVKEILSSEQTDKVTEFSGWEKYWLCHDSDQGFQNNPGAFPSLPVRVASRDFRRVLKAERAVTYQPNRNSNDGRRMQQIATQ